ncbi:MAG: hypothetical protein JXC85_02845 [Candidatus Aenigmarchaeota archaeon]|nr:hypothetical protein [Candidatus Aenigmarchaeota archaeon]
MGMKSQISFLSGTPMQLILVLIAAIGFLAFVTLGAGNITQFLRETCEKYPELPFCGGLEAVEARDYQTAKASTEALVCAINSVAQGSEWLGGGQIDCNEYFGKSGPVAVPDSDYERIEKSINAGLGVFDDEGCRDRCIEELCQGIPGCEVESSTYIETLKTVDAGHEGDVNYTSRRCECVVGISNDPRVSCGQEETEKFEYYAVREAGTILECECIYSGGSENIIKSKAFGLTKEQAVYNCHDLAKRDVEIQCEEINIEDSPGGNAWYLSIQADSVILKGEMRRGLCKLDGEREKFHVYGYDDTNVFAQCDYDYDASRFSINPWLINTAVSREVVKYEDFTGELIFYKKDFTGRVPYYYQANQFECALSNFELPQEITDWEEWVPWHGDPRFLIYWQNFPAEEDMWTMKTNWKLYVVLGIISVLPVLKSARIVAGTAARAVLSRIFSSLGKEAAENVIKKGVTTSMIKKASTTAVKNMMKKGTLSKTVGGEVLSRLGRANINNAMKEAGGELAERIARTSVAQAPQIAQEYAVDAAGRALTQAGLYGIPQEAAEKLMKESGEAASRQALKYMGAYGMREQFVKLIGDRVVGKELPWTALKFSTLVGAARIAEIADSMTQARFEVFPNEIVLKEALGSPDEFDLVDEMDGSPVLIVVPNRESKYILPQVFDTEKTFHMASPCYLESVTVSGVDARCSEYTYNREEDGSTFTSCGGEIEITGKGEPCDINLYGMSNLGPMEFIYYLHAIPDPMSVIYNDEKALDEGKNAYAPIEYEEDCPTTIQCGSNNVYYHFDGTEWKWKSPSANIDDYRPVQQVSDTEWQNLEQNYDFETAHFDIMNGLAGKNFESGVSVIQSTLNSDKDTKGGKTSDDYLIIHQFKKSPSETSPSDNYNNLAEIMTEDVSMSAGYYIIPFAESTLLYYKPEPETLKIGKVEGDKITTYELTKDSESYLHNVYTPVDFEDVVDIQKSSSTRLGERTAIITTFRIDVPDWSDSYGGDITWVNIEINNPDEKAIEIEPSSVNGGIFATITLSDEGDNGILHSIIIEQDDKAKTMTDFNYDMEGFDYYNLRNCISKGVIVEMGKKKGDATNYCTGGLSTGKAWLEYGGDIALVAGVVVGTCLGGWPGAAVAAVGGLIETGSEYASEKMGEWPNSW